MEGGFVSCLKDGGINKQTLKVLKKEKVLDAATLSRYTDNDLDTFNRMYKLGQGQVINLRSVRDQLVSEASPKVYVNRHAARFSRCVHVCVCVCACVRCVWCMRAVCVTRITY